MSLSPTVLWLIAGFVMVIAEMFSLSLVLLFFGMAAFIVAGAKFFFDLDNLTVEIILFAVTGLGSMLLFRTKLKHSIRSGKGMSIDENSWVVLSEDIPARGSADISYQGARWTAMNESEVGLKKGAKAYIHGTEGVKLVISAHPKKSYE